MKKDYIKRKKLMSKKMFVTICIVVVVVVSVAFIGTHFAIDYIFDNYVMKSTLEMAQEKMEEMEEVEEVIALQDPQAEETPAPTPQATVIPEASELPESKPAEPVKRKLTTAEIAYKVLESPKLISMLAGMVSSSDKSAVIGIAKSCFTLEEKKYYVKQIAQQGMTGQIKSEMMAIVQSRMTADKKNRVLSLFAKYAETLRPYVE